MDTLTPLDIYLWQQADSIKALCMVFGFAASFICAIVCVVREDAGEDQLPSLWLGGLFSVLVFFAGFLIPNSRTIALMYAVPKITESRVVQEDMPEIYEQAVKVLKDQLNKVGEE